jgi:hypothetical protein
LTDGAHFKSLVSLKDCAHVLWRHLIVPIPQRNFDQESVLKNHRASNLKRGNLRCDIPIK